MGLYGSPYDYYVIHVVLIATPRTSLITNFQLPPLEGYIHYVYIQIGDINIRRQVGALPDHSPLA